MSTTNYTDTQLKQALAKMLPERLFYNSGCRWFEFFTDDKQWLPIRDTELLHLCWLAEETLVDVETAGYCNQLIDFVSNKVGAWSFHANWQQRVVALAKVKGVEIV